MTTLSRELLTPSGSLRRYEGEYGAHVHDHAQVLVGVRGHLQVELAGRATFVDPSCGLVVPAGVAHGFLADSSVSMLVVDCPVDKGLERVRRFVPPSQWKTPVDQFDVFAALESIAGAQYQITRRHLDLAQVNSAIDSNLHEQWSTARLAAMCSLSAQRFHARFIELTGLSPGAYVRQRRLDEAVRLLKGGLLLETTALHVGYGSASALAFALRRERGIRSRNLR
jgi:AraC-like DNA-binding protein